MSDWLLNGRPVLAGRVTAPLSGRWHAELVIDTLDGVSGAAELVIGGVRWAGTTYRSGIEADTCFAGLVGGTRGLDRRVDARSWHGLQPARGLVQELLSEVGEVLYEGSGAELDVHLPRWSRVECPADHALAQLVDAIGARWRMTIDGSVWIGTETWPELILPDAVRAELLGTEPRAGRATYSLPGAYLLPGQTFEGRRVGAVVYELAGGVDRAKVWWTDG